MKTTDNSHLPRHRSALLVSSAIVIMAGLISLYLIIGQTTEPKDSPLNHYSEQPHSTSENSPSITEATSVTAPPAPIRIIALGDSLTAGYGLPLAESYPSQLESRLRSKGFHVEMINAGISGETTAGTLERVAFIRAQTPDLVLLGIGGNDMLRFFPLETTEKNLRGILQKLTAPPNPPHLILLQIQATENLGTAEKLAFDALYPRLAEEFNLTLVPFVAPAIFLNPALIQQDGIHPNRDGYTQIVESYIAPTVELFLKKSD